MVNPQEGGTGWKASAVEQDQLVFKAVFPEAQKILEKDKIYPKDFADIYGEERVALDSDYVRTKKDEAESKRSLEEREAKKEALIFEALFHNGANQHGWLGEMARVIKTSDFDDWKNGVDGVVEFKKTDNSVEHLAIGVDVTFSNQLAEKFKRIKDGIDGITEEGLATINYFQSGNFRGELTNVPRVIVGIDRGHLVNLAREVFIRPDKARLLRHPVQILQLRQIVLELDTFAEYAKRIGKEDSVAIFRRDAKIAREILQKKSATEGVRIGDWQDDKVFQAIQKELEAFV